MEFKKYQHIERFGTTEVENIELGLCYIYPKIDGTNSCVYLKDGSIQAGSRNRELTLDNDNAGFYNYIINHHNIIQCLLDNPKIRIYGEWLVPHSLKTYRDDCWRKFYVFDVVEDLDDGNFRYMNYEEYRELCEKYGIEYIPPLAIVDKPSYERLIEILNANDYLIQDGKGIGEGIVIKRYDYVNKYGRTTWAKIVSSEFKEKHAKTMKHRDNAEKGASMTEEKIIDKYVTQALCDKVLAKIEQEKGEWHSKYIPMLLNMVYYDLVREECWNFVKEFKNPTINFKTLSYLCNEKVKEKLNKLF